MQQVQQVHVHATGPMEESMVSTFSRTPRLTDSLAESTENENIVAGTSMVAMFFARTQGLEKRVIHHQLQLSCSGQEPTTATVSPICVVWRLFWAGVWPGTAKGTYSTCLTQNQAKEKEEEKEHDFLGEGK